MAEFSNEIMDFSREKGIFLNHYEELICDAMEQRSFAEYDYGKRLMPEDQFLKNLIISIANFQAKNLSPEAIYEEVYDFTYDQYLLLFFENGINVKWYRLTRKVTD